MAKDRGMMFGTGISIHALVKRATYFGTSFDNKIFISIHALVKRATQMADIITCGIMISIHALVKRATKWIFAR